jgi:hypothetical protein
LFISAKSRMSVSQIVAEISFDLSLPASAKSSSIFARMSLVCSVIEAPGALSATWPAV